MLHTWGETCTHLKDERQQGEEQDGGHGSHSLAGDLDAGNGDPQTAAHQQSSGTEYKGQQVTISSVMCVKSKSTSKKRSAV
eukprot:1156783-Pelagomonas_calceolata.AAC.4